MEKIFIRHILLILVAFSAIGTAIAQNPLQNNGYDNNPYDENSEYYDPNDPNAAFYNQQDSMPQIDPNTVPVHVEMWKVSELLGEIIPIEVDTTYKYYYNTCLEEGLRSTYNFLGNLGSPRYSRIFFDRSNTNQNIFVTPYSFIYKNPGEFRFVNTKSPYTNLDYYMGGDKHEGEERFKAYFGISANKHFSTGFNVDYIYGRGYYQKQSTAHLNGAYFASYIGDRYDANFLFNYCRLKMRENGGIVNDTYITDPTSMNEGKTEYTSSDIPIRFANNDAWNTNKNFYIYLTHKLKFGFYKEYEDTTINRDKLPKDSIPPKIKEYVPVTNIIHTIKVDRSKRNFLSYGIPENYFENQYMPGDTIDDQFNYLSVKNTVGISLLEGFNKWAKFGLTAFASYELRQFNMIDSTMNQSNRFAMRKYTQHDLAVGGELSKRQGTLLHYHAIGQISLAGANIGDFNVSGDIDLNFRMFSDTVQLKANAYIKNSSPLFYYNKYHSKNFWWDNNFSKEWRYNVNGTLSVDRWGTNLNVGVENIKNYIYFDNRAMSAQYTGNIQVFSARLRQDFKLWILHLDNEISYQKSSNEEILPLPEISLYHNLYLSTTLAKKVLRVELGADLRYFTRYYAEAYNPATGQFHLQASNDKVRIGGYPLVNVYLNLALKRTRIFVMMSHINAGSGNRNYFYAPHYPLNQRLFKFGISWNFYD